MSLARESTYTPGINICIYVLKLPCMIFFFFFLVIEDIGRGFNREGYLVVCRNRCFCLNGLGVA